MYVRSRRRRLANGAHNIVLAVVRGIRDGSRVVQKFIAHLGVINGNHEAALPGIHRRLEGLCGSDHEQLIKLRLSLAKRIKKLGL